MQTDLGVLVTLIFGNVGVELEMAPETLVPGRRNGSFPGLSGLGLLGGLPWPRAFFFRRGAAAAGLDPTRSRPLAGSRGRVLEEIFLRLGLLRHLDLDGLTLTWSWTRWWDERRGRLRLQVEVRFGLGTGWKNFFSEEPKNVLLLSLTSKRSVQFPGIGIKN